MQAVTFSPDGNRIAAVATDDAHTMFIWEWNKKIVLYNNKTQPGKPPAVYAVVWSKFEPNK